MEKSNENLAITALIFDMDGLLFDSERIVQRSWEISGNELGIPGMGEVIYHTLGMNRSGRNAYFREHIREDFPCEEFGNRTRENFWKIVDNEGLPLKKGAKNLLEYGKAHGYKMAVATSSSRDYAMNNLKSAGIDIYFDSVICGDMVKKAKPDPEIYIRSGEELGEKPENCLALEDAPGGIEAAYLAGMHPVMIPDLVTPTENVRKRTYQVLDSLEDIIELLEKNSLRR